MSLKAALGVAVGCAFALAQACAYAQAAGPYETNTDAELTELAAQWETLDQDDRRALLTEIRSRMALTGKGPVLTIKSQRRYGRIVRDAEGNQVRIETTHVVRLKRVAPRATEQPFGVGFEQRQVTEERPTPEPGAGREGEDPLPVIHVGTPAKTP